MAYFERPNIKIWYERHRSPAAKAKTPVIGVMGMAAHADFWSPNFIEHISSKFEFIVFDNRGCARSTGTTDHLSIATMANDVHDLISEILGTMENRTQKVHMIGVSMGGMISLAFALRYPNLLQSLTLCCTTAKPKKFDLDPAKVKPAIESLRGGGKMSPLLFSKEYMQKNPDKIAAFDQMVKSHEVPKSVVWEQIKASWVFNVRDRLSDIKVPTLIMSGDRDIVIPVDSSHDLHNGIAGSLLKIFPGSGHGFISENQDEVLETLIPFLESV